MSVLMLYVYCPEQDGFRLHLFSWKLIRTVHKCHKEKVCLQFSSFDRVSMKANGSINICPSMQGRKTEKKVIKRFLQTQHCFSLIALLTQWFTCNQFQLVDTQFHTHTAVSGYCSKLKSNECTVSIKWAEQLS